MKTLNIDLIRKLSFPDFKVEKIELFPDKKKLIILIEGAWLDLDKGKELGNGVLVLKNWKGFSIRAFDAESENWNEISINKIDDDYLKDICEIEFANNSVSLYGFGKKSNRWMEWKINQAKIHAEFNSISK